MLEHRFRKSLIMKLLVSHASMIISCDKSVSGSPATQSIPVIEWDFSDGEDLGRLNIPWTSPQEVQYIYGGWHGLVLQPVSQGDDNRCNTNL